MNIVQIALLVFIQIASLLTSPASIVPASHDGMATIEMGNALGNTTSLTMQSHGSEINTHFRSGLIASGYKGVTITCDNISGNIRYTIKANKVRSGYCDRIHIVNTDPSIVVMVKVHILSGQVVWTVKTRGATISSQPYITYENSLTLRPEAQESVVLNIE
jgi:hypothetical protein